MLSPKRVKHRKQHRGRRAGMSRGQVKVQFGEYGLKALDAGWLTNRQIEAARIAMTRKIKRGGKVWINVYPDKPFTKKPAETRMGSGKGSPEGWGAVVKPGRVMFELAGGPAPPARGGPRHAGELEHHAARLDHRDPALGRALALAHAGLERLLGVGLVGEDVDPHLAAAADLAGHRDTGSLDLTVGDPTVLERLDPVVAELDLVLALGLAPAATAVHLAVLGAPRKQHQAFSSLSAAGSAAGASSAAGAGGVVS